MNKIYDIENTLLIHGYRKRFFFYCLKKEPKLLIDVFVHMYACVLYALHLISKVTYIQIYWTFLKKIETKQYVNAFAKNVLCKEPIPIDEKGVYIAYAPIEFVKVLLPKIRVLCIEHMSTEKAHLVYLMQKYQVVNYATVEIFDKPLCKVAQKIYYVDKGKLIEKTPQTTAKRYSFQIGMLILLSILTTIFVLLLTPSSLKLGLQLMSNPLVILVNFIPVFFLMLILYGIFQSMQGSFIINTFIFVSLVEINRFKIAFRDDPFVFMDIEYASEAAQMTSNYTLYLDKMTIFVLLTFLLVIFILHRMYLKKQCPTIVRLLCILLPIISFPVLYNVVYLNTTIYDSMWHSEFGNQWKEANQFVARGFNYSFVRSYDEGRVKVPDSYDEQFVVDSLESYDEINMLESQKVNMISIMLEAYNDVSVVSPSAEIDPSVYENMHNIQKESYAGLLYTDIFAGGTIASERSYLSGYSTLGDFRFATNSYVDYFNKQGYYTEAMHPCYGWFYNRKNVNDIGFGFNNFDFHENKYEEMIDNGAFDDTFFGFLTDNDFFDQIILGYENNKERNIPYFNYSVTYQNHGPYSDVDQGNGELLKRKDSYNEENYNIVNNYLANIKATDEAIGKLYDYINAQSEPIVLVMYGDHNPYLGEEDAGFNLLDIDLDLGTIEGGQNYYQTPYVITANQAAKDALDSDFKGVGNTISPMFLMNEVFDVAKLNIGSAYSQYLKELKQSIDVINPIYIKRDHVFILRDEYEDDGTLETFYNLQYFEQDSANYLK